MSNHPENPENPENPDSNILINTSLNQMFLISILKE
jgi:hypothetical protein